MAKAKQRHKKDGPVLSPEQTLRFLEDFRTTVANVDETSQLISIRVPKNVLRSFKSTAKHRNLKYQTQIVQLMREWIKEN